MKRWRFRVVILALCAASSVSAEPTDKQVPSASPAVHVTSGVVTVAVDDVETSAEALVDLAENMDGYLVRQFRERITLRVPMGALNGFLADLDKLGDASSRRIRVRDVGEQLANLRTRRRLNTETERRLQELLSRAETIADTLAIEERLRENAFEGDSVTQTIDNLERLAAVATVEVTLVARNDGPPEQGTAPFFWLRTLGIGNLHRRHK